MKFESILSTLLKIYHEKFINNGILQIKEIIKNNNITQNELNYNKNINLLEMKILNSLNFTIEDRFLIEKLEVKINNEYFEINFLNLLLKNSDLVDCKNKI
jgi:hypothetical protein